MKILITGAGGSVGESCVEHFSESNEVLALNHRALDIADRQAVGQIILDHKPEVIINCAVLGVDACEDDPSLAWQINVAGPRNLAEAAAQIDTAILHFSSNYVFDGRRTGSAYTIEDTPSPINEYGRTKLAGEQAVINSGQRSYVVRTSWVFGGRNDNFLSTAPKQLSSGRRISAITDVKASTTYVLDLVRRVEEILMHKRYGTYHVVNGGACSYFEFAKEAARILDLSDVETANLIEPVREDAMNRRATRPRYSPMRCILSEELGLPALRDWRVALRDYVSEQL